MDTHHQLPPTFTPTTPPSPSVQMSSTTTTTHFQIPTIHIDAAPSEDRYTSLPARSLRLKLNTSDNTNTAFANVAQSPIRRWRGPGAGYGSLHLRVPSVAATSGSRQNLARQGLATGSFKLNCAESVFAAGRRNRDACWEMGASSRPEGGKERKENAAGGMEEREAPPVKEGRVNVPRPLDEGHVRDAKLHHPPPKIRPRLDIFNEEFEIFPYQAEEPLPDPSQTSPTTSFIDEIKSSLASGFKHGLRQPKASAKLPSLSSSSFSLNTMARSYTFTEGLCNLAAPDDDERSEETDSSTCKQNIQATKMKTKTKSRLGLQPGMRASISVSVFGSGSLRRLARSMDSTSRKWIDSLKRMQLKERKAIGEGETCQPTSSSSLSSDINLERLSSGASISRRPVLDIFPELRVFGRNNFNFSIKHFGHGHGSSDPLREKKRKSCSHLRMSVSSSSLEVKSQAHYSTTPDGDSRQKGQREGFPRSASLPATTLGLETVASMEGGILKVLQEAGMNDVFVEVEG